MDSSAVVIGRMRVAHPALTWLVGDARDLRGTLGEDYGADGAYGAVVDKVREGQGGGRLLACGSTRVFACVYALPVMYPKGLRRKKQLRFTNSVSEGVSKRSLATRPNPAM